MSENIIQNELNYISSRQLLKTYLEKGIITENQFLEVDRLNAKSFKSELYCCI